MSIRLMSLVWELALPPTEKIVLLALADQASDEGTQCWPSVARIAQRCGLAARSVRRALSGLEAGGHVTRDHRDGASTDYRIHPCRSVAPAGASALTEGGGVGAGAFGGFSGAVSPPDRPARMPPDFVPEMTGKAGVVIAGWPPRRLAAELDQFADYHRAKGTRSFDWQASWRSWVRKAQQWEPEGAVPRPSRSARAAVPDADPILTALRRAVAEERAERSQADHPRARPALSPERG